MSQTQRSKGHELQFPGSVVQYHSATIGTFFKQYFKKSSDVMFSYHFCACDIIYVCIFQTTELTFTGCLLCSRLYPCLNSFKPYHSFILVLGK